MPPPLRGGVRAVRFRTQPVVARAWRFGLGYSLGTRERGPLPPRRQAHPLEDCLHAGHHSSGARLASGCWQGLPERPHRCVVGSAAIFAMSAANRRPCIEVAEEVGRGVVELAQVDRVVPDVAFAIISARPARRPRGPLVFFDFAGSVREPFLGVSWVPSFGRQVAEVVP